MPELEGSLLITTPGEYMQSAKYMLRSECWCAMTQPLFQRCRVARASLLVYFIAPVLLQQPAARGRRGPTPTTAGAAQLLHNYCTASVRGALRGQRSCTIQLQNAAFRLVFNGFEAMCVLGQGAVQVLHSYCTVTAQLLHSYCTVTAQLLHVEP